MPFQPILADWIEAIVPLLVALFLAARAYLEARAEQRRPEAIDLDDLEPMELDNKQADRRPVEARQAAGRGNDTDVEDFLRRLADEQRADRSEPQPERQPKKPKPKRPVQKPQRRSQPTAAAEQPAVSESVDDHVRRHLRHLEESQLAEEAAHLGESIALTDDRLEARLKSKFDKQLGTLRRQEVATEEAKALATPADPGSIAEMLASPTGMRNAVILSEILNRPDDRW